jgi:hypothetical protein
MLKEGYHATKKIGLMPVVWEQGMDPLLDRVECNLISNVYIYSC